MLSDIDIRNAIENGDLEIENLDSLEEQLQPVGVDVRIASDYLHKATNTVYELENSDTSYLSFEPGVFYNVHTIEKLSLPNNLVAKISLRATFERKGLYMSVGSIAPGFEGTLVFGLSNRSEREIHVKPGTPLFQLEFYELSSEAETTYDDKVDSQYQHQTGVSE